MSKLTEFFKRLFKKTASCDEKDDSAALDIPSSLELVAKISDKLDQEAASSDDDFNLEKLLADDMLETLENERLRYHECLLQIDGISDLENKRFEIINMNPKIIIGPIVILTKKLVIKKLTLIVLNILAIIGAIANCAAKLTASVS